MNPRGLFISERLLFEELSNLRRSKALNDGRTRVGLHAWANGLADFGAFVNVNGADGLVQNPGGTLGFPHDLEGVVGRNLIKVGTVPVGDNHQVPVVVGEPVHKHIRPGTSAEDEIRSIAVYRLGLEEGSPTGPAESTRERE